MNTAAWKFAITGLRLARERIHAFGRRLRAAGVFEDRQDLLGYNFWRITTHYSIPELESLITATNLVCGEQSRKSPALAILRKNIPLRLVGNRSG